MRGQVAEMFVNLLRRLGPDIDSLETSMPVFRLRPHLRVILQRDIFEIPRGFLCLREVHRRRPLKDGSSQAFNPCP